MLAKSEDDTVCGLNACISTAAAAAVGKLVAGSVAARLTGGVSIGGGRSVMR